jgi:hypothetical protein
MVLKIKNLTEEINKINYKIQKCLGTIFLEGI